MDIKSVQLLQNETRQLLSNYVRRVRPDEPWHLAQLLHTVPSLRAASSAAVSQLFFTDIVSVVPMDRLVVDIYRQMSIFTAD